MKARMTSWVRRVVEEAGGWTLDAVTDKAVTKKGLIFLKISKIIHILLKFR
jgi:hypothetical protein